MPAPSAWRPAIGSAVSSRLPRSRLGRPVRAFARLRMHLDQGAPLADDVPAGDAQEIRERRSAVRLEAREGSDRITRDRVVEADLFRFAARGFETLHQRELDAGLHLVELGLGDRIADD